MPPSIRSKAIAVVALVALAGLAGCATVPEEDETSTLTVAGRTDVGYNPMGNFSEHFGNLAIQAVYDTLVRWNEETAVFDPCLASGYTLSDDKRVLDVVLRDDVDFTDGAHLNAEGVVKLFSESEVIGGAMAPYAPEYEVTGEYSFRVTGESAFDRGVFQLLDTMPIPSPEALDDPALDTTPVGSGPYILDSENSTAGVELRYSRNPDYWNPDLYPYDALVIKSFDDNIAALNALKSGQIDATSLDVGSVAEAEESGFSVTTGNATFQTLVLGDRAGAITPAIGDLRVRQAINMAFDRAAINDAIEFGLGGVSSQPFKAGQAEHIDGADDEYPYDPERARELLAEAGYPDGFALTIPVISGLGSDGVIPVVQQALTDIGIAVTFDRYQDFDPYMAAVAESSVILLNEYYINTMSNHLRVTGFLTVWGTDARVLDLIATIDTGDAESSATASQELGRLILDEAWFAPFSQVPTAWASIVDVQVELEQVTAGIRLENITPSR